MNELNKEWTVTPRGNLILKGDGFYISYNSMVNNEFITMFPELASDEGDSETALCKSDSWGKVTAYILNGDFRKEYEQWVDKGWGECIKFFDSKSEHKSSWSDK